MPTNLGVQAVRGHLLDPDERQEPGHQESRRAELCLSEDQRYDSLARHVSRYKAICILLEHCLMGIKGTVRRSTDGDFIHANVDIDLIIDEEAEPGSLDKPVEMFHIIEHFCLGERQMMRHAACVTDVQKLRYRMC